MRDRTLRVVTWNIHGGVGPDRRRNLDRLTAVIARHAPDILALREVDSRARESPSQSAFGSARVHASAAATPFGASEEAGLFFRQSER